MGYVEFNVPEFNVPLGHSKLRKETGVPVSPTIVLMEYSSLEVQN